MATVLATAFADDPVVTWLLPERRRHRAMFTALVSNVHAAPDCSDVAVDRGAIVGAALWDPPGHRPGRRHAAVGGLRLACALGSALRRGVALESAFARHRPEEPHWYLAQIGAAAPGRGIGSELLATRLGRIDLPAYLECSSEANLPLYARHGFTVIDEVDLPYAGPRVWLMLRRG